MASSEPILEALPLDRTSDAGPVHRGGPLTWFIAIACGFAALGAGLLLKEEGRRTWALLCLAILGAASLYAVWCLLEHVRHRVKLPASHAVLAGTLGFEIHCTCHDVAATVFFLPDETVAGSNTRLLCFLENYASRQRVATFQIGPHPQLGLKEIRRVSLKLAAGQAALYSLPLTLSPDIAPGEHDLPVMLQVKRPAGTGMRLPGARRHLYDIWTCRFAAPFTVTSPGITTAAHASAPSSPAQYITLASVSETTARLEPLTALLVAESAPASRPLTA